MLGRKNKDQGEDTAAEDTTNTDSGTGTTSEPHDVNNPPDVNPGSDQIDDRQQPRKPEDSDAGSGGGEL